MNTTYQSNHTHFSDLAGRTTHRLMLSLALTAIFVLVEITAGVISNSLTLLTDAAHNFTDVIALGLSWYALKIASKPANAGQTFGYHRVGILVALVNSTTLILISLGIFIESYHRFMSPPIVDSTILIGVGAAAFFINLATAWLVKHGSEHDLNLRSAFLHLMGDVLSTLGAVTAGVLILLTKWNWLDPLASILIAFFILGNAWSILRQAIHILLESTPKNLDVDNLLNHLRQIDGVIDVHDLHVWSINENLRMLSAHVVTDDIPVSSELVIQNNINELLAHEFNIQHATLQMECEGCGNGLLYCEIKPHQQEHIVPYSN